MEWNFKVLDDNGNAIEPEQPEVESQEELTEDVNTEVQEEVLEEAPEVSEPEVVEETPEVEEPVVAAQEPEVDVDSLYARIKELEEAKVQTNTEELPEDVAKFLEYRKETGRGFEDYLELQKDWNSVDDNKVLRQYYKETKPHLDDEDIEFLINKNFSYDEDYAEEDEIRGKKVALKDELYKARNHFNDLKERYKAPLESSAASLPEDAKEAYEFYNDYKQSSQKEQELAEQRAKVFAEKTNSLFNEEFKGFEFDLGEKKQAFVPKDVNKVKEFQSDISNFFAQHLDENGIIKDATSYHKALFAATNADAMAKYFYEQGRADATNGIVKETKNIDMSVRDNKGVESGVPKIRLVNDSSSEFKLKF